MAPASSLVVQSMWASASGSSPRWAWTWNECNMVGLLLVVGQRRGDAALHIVAYRARRVSRCSDGEPPPNARPPPGGGGRAGGAPGRLRGGRGAVGLGLRRLGVGRLRAARGALAGGGLRGLQRLLGAAQLERRAVGVLRRLRLAVLQRLGGLGVTRLEGRDLRLELLDAALGGDRLARGGLDGGGLARGL